ncbi:hypothetical protein BDB00DRAFT_943624 [Zychaea mexicana]|uniref:uncharacterized protein n=1 Tax=Zychaea mexicana TaxID=64656 RepID=UPI0022FDD0E3|nr:uncharacterized protein BDB00DRAFT_943624 [Zychaea mexicana]KAI9474329.1 hypothetical protein BDB00DRAFT_943624 [Zychaea mexicana]
MTVICRSVKHSLETRSTVYSNLKGDITIKEILDNYQHDPELLKLVLLAKAEEDKQQVIARVTSDHQHHQPASPAGYYPHSAHPLCPPSVSEQPQPQPQQQQQQQQQQQSTSRSSYYNNREQNNHVGNKRPHDAKLSHDQVMEVLKAKLQRGSNAAEKNKRARTLPNPLGNTNTAPTTTTSTNTTTTASTPSTNNNTTTTTSTTTPTAKPALPPPPQHHPQPHPPLSTPSPRSAKPVLPPIDTSVGRIPSRGPLSSNASHKLPPFSATAALADALVIKGERRVKSLSPPPFGTATTTTTTTATTTTTTAAAAVSHRNS